MSSKKQGASAATSASRTQRELAALLATGVDDELAAAGWQLIAAARRILIIGHYNPDPDALGSALGLAAALRPLGKRCVVACADATPARFAFLPGWDAVVTELPDDDFDLVIALDAGEWSRYGALYERNQAFFDHVTTLNIDHHITSRGVGAINIIDPRCAATAELLTVFLLNRGVAIGREAAIGLLAGIITDTRAFEYDATTEQTLAAGAYLVGQGAVPQDIIKPMYRMKPFEQLRLWGRVLATAQRTDDRRVIWAVLHERDLRESGATSDMDDGLPGYLIDTDDAAIALLFREREPGVTRVSIRTIAPYDAAAVAATFGGGGHVRAAGCTLQMDAEAAVAALLPVAGAAIADVAEPR